MSSNEKILIVEDALTQSLRLQKTLKNAGIDSVAVRSGQEALELLSKESHFRGIVSDINMPGLSGFELCSKLKENEATKNIPFFILVSLKEPLDALNAMMSAADNILLKDYDRNYLAPQLLTAIKNAEAARSCGASAVKISFDGQEYELNAPATTLAAMAVSAFAIAVHERSARLSEMKPAAEAQ